MKKGDLVFAWNYVEWGGVQTYSLSLIRRLSDHYDITAVMPESSGDEIRNMFASAGAKLLFFSPATEIRPARSFFSKIRRRWLMLQSEWALIRQLLKLPSSAIINIDLSPERSFLPLLVLCLRFHVFYTQPNSFAYNGFFRRYLREIKLWLLSLSPRLHFFSQNTDAYDYLLRRVAVLARKRVSLVKASIDPLFFLNLNNQEFDRSAYLENLRIPSDKVIILTVGQFIDRKGRWPYLDAVKEITDKRDNIFFVWVMPDNPLPEDISRINGYGIESFRILLSRDLGSTHEDVVAAFRIADIFVLPSFVEGLPLALLETMALGLPCICSRINAIPEVIKHEKTGLLVEAGNVKELREAIERLSIDADLRISLGAAGQKLILAEFDENKAGQIALAEFSKYSMN